jgi:hypothetical protein
VVLVIVLVVAPGGGGGDDAVRTDNASATGKTGKTSGRDATNGSKPGHTTTTPATTTTLVPGEAPGTTGDGGSATPGGDSTGGGTTGTTAGGGTGTGPTTPGATTPTTRATTTTASTTTTTRPPAPAIRSFTVSAVAGPCQIKGQVLYQFTWSGAGTVTRGSVVNDTTGAGVITGIAKPNGSQQLCTGRATSWTLTLYNGSSSASRTAKPG